MKKKLLLLSLLLSAITYGEGEDTFFQSDESINTTRLEESVISTTGFETSVRNTPNNVSIITSEEIEEKNYDSVEDALKDIPSININQNVFGSSIDLRGQGSSTKGKANVQVLIDGVLINPLDGTHGTLPLSSIDIENVESIEVIPGGGSILYGGGTAGGVINIITKNKSKMTPNNAVKFQLGSYNKKEVGASAGYNYKDKLLLQFDYNGIDQDGYREGTSLTSNHYDILAKYSITDKQALSLKYGRYEEQSAGDTAYLTRKQLDEDRNQSGVSAENIYSGDLTRDEVVGGYSYDISDNLKFDLNLSYQETSNKVIKSGTQYNMAFDEDTEFMDKKVVAKPKFKFGYGNESSLIIGYDYIHADTSRDYQYNYPSMGLTGGILYDSKKVSHGAFALNTYKISNFELTQGFRYEYAKYNTNRNNTGSGAVDYSGDRTIDNQAYELAINYLYSDTGNTYFRWEQGYTAPAPNQLVDKYGTADYRMNDIQSEIHTTYEVGVRDYFLKSYVNLTGFYTIKKDEIFVDMNGTKEWYYSNIDETTRAGVEVSAEQYFGKLTLKEAYTYIDARITEGTNDGNYIPNVARHAASISAKYEFTNKLNTVLTTTYKDKVYLNEANNGGKVNDTITTDLVVNYNFENGLRVFGGINNIFDVSNYNNASYDNTTKEYTYDPAQERTYSVGFRYNF